MNNALPLKVLIHRGENYQGYCAGGECCSHAIRVADGKAKIGDRCHCDRVISAGPFGPFEVPGRHLKLVPKFMVVVTEKAK